MKKMIVTSPGKVDADAVDIIMNDSVEKAMCNLLGVMKAFERLARLMSARVRARFGVVLEPEIRGLVTGDGDSATTTRQPRPQTPETSHTT